MNLRIICVGKPDRVMFAPAIAEYEKRLSRFCQLDVRQIAEGPVPRNDAQIDKCLRIEGEKILSCIKPGDRVVAMYIEGKQLSSPELAKQIKEFQDYGQGGTLTYIIGSSHGLCDEVIRRADIKLSMSRMTFPHQLARVMLTEQIYRAFTILSGQTYHK